MGRWCVIIIFCYLTCNVVVVSSRLCSAQWPWWCPTMLWLPRSPYTRLVSTRPRSSPRRSPVPSNSPQNSSAHRYIYHPPMWKIKCIKKKKNEWGIVGLLLKHLLAYFQGIIIVFFYDIFLCWCFKYWKYMYRFVRILYFKQISVDRNDCIKNICRTFKSYSLLKIMYINRKRSLPNFQISLMLLWLFLLVIYCKSRNIWGTLIFRGFCAKIGKHKF